MRSWLVILVPLLLLAADWMRAPRVFQTQIGPPLPDVGEIRAHAPIHLGRLRGNEFFISFDIIRSERFLECCRSTRNAVVVGRWKPKRGGAQTGPLGRAVRSRLLRTDLRAHGEVADSLLHPGEPGNVDCVDVSPGEDLEFPVHAVHIVTFSVDADLEQQRREWALGLSGAFKCAGTQEIEMLLLPSIGIDPTKPDLPYTALYSSVFEATPALGGGKTVRLSWFENWDNRNFAAAHGAVEALHQPVFNPGSLDLTLESPKTRLACLAFALCLWSASRRAHMTPIRWVALVLAYGAAFPAAQALVSSLYGGSGNGPFIVSVALTLGLAVLFPVLATVNLGSLFTRREA